MPNKNKPLLLRPSGKDYLWGGSRLNDEFEKNIDLTPLAETWECSTHPDGPSYVVGGEFDGKELAEVLKAHPEYLGERHKGECTLSKNANPSRSRRKNLSRNEKSNDTTNENRLCRRLADTRDLKSLSGDRVRVQAPPVA